MGGREPVAVSGTVTRTSRIPPFSLFTNRPFENNLRRIQVTGGGPEVCTNPAGADYDMVPPRPVTSLELLIRPCVALV